MAVGARPTSRPRPPPRAGRRPTSPTPPTRACIRVGGRYYAYTTNRTGAVRRPAARAGAPLGRPRELDRPRATPSRTCPAGSSRAGPGRRRVFRDGDAYVLFYTATERSTGRQCIGKARADHARPGRSGTPGGDRSSASAASAARSTRTSSGTATAPATCSGRTTGTAAATGCRCGPSASTTTSGWSGRPHRLLSYDRSWERPLIENPAMVRSPDRDGEYRLFYAANWWESSSYATGFARCNGPLGPVPQGHDDRAVARLAPTSPTARAAPPSSPTPAGGTGWPSTAGPDRPDTVGYGNGGRRTLFIEKVDFSDRRPRVNTDLPLRLRAGRAPPLRRRARLGRRRRDLGVAPATSSTATPTAPTGRSGPTGRCTRGDAVPQVRELPARPPRRHPAPARTTRSPGARPPASSTTPPASPTSAAPAFDHDLTDVPRTPARPPCASSSTTPTAADRSRPSPAASPTTPSARASSSTGPPGSASSTASAPGRLSAGRLG